MFDKTAFIRMKCFLAYAFFIISIFFSSSSHAAYPVVVNQKDLALPVHCAQYLYMPALLDKLKPSDVVPLDRVILRYDISAQEVRFYNGKRTFYKNMNLPGIIDTEKGVYITLRGDVQIFQNYLVVYEGENREDVTIYDLNSADYKVHSQYWILDQGNHARVQVAGVSNNGKAVVFSELMRGNYLNDRKSSTYPTFTNN